MKESNNKPFFRKKEVQVKTGRRIINHMENQVRESTLNRTAKSFFQKGTLISLGKYADIPF
jgi:hypothetical protein